MDYKIRKKERKDCADVAHVVTVAWNETYRGIVPDEFLDNLYNNEEERAKNSYNKFDEKENHQYVLEVDDKHTVMEIMLYQGLNRQIRKMFEHLGFEVLTLKRIQHATLNLDGLKRGDLKPIKPQQIKELRNFLNRLASKK